MDCSIGHRKRLPEALRSRAVGAGTTLFVHVGVGWLLWAGLGAPARTAPQPLAVRFVQEAPPAPVAAAPQPQPQPELAKVEPAPVKPPPPEVVPPEPPPPKPVARVEPKKPPKPERPRKREQREQRIVQRVEQPEAVAEAPVPPPEPVARTEPVEPAPAPAAATPPALATEKAERAPSAATSAPSAAKPETLASAAPASVPITLPRSEAAYLRNPAPAYPTISRRLREQGLVVLRVFVQPDGRPSEVAVGTSSGSTRLDSAALDAVRAWTFVPAQRGKERVAAWVLVPVHFRLENG